MGLIPILASMERIGVPIDLEIVPNLEKSLEKKCSDLVQEARLCHIYLYLYILSLSFSFSLSLSYLYFRKNKWCKWGFSRFSKANIRSSLLVYFFFSFPFSFLFSLFLSLTLPLAAPPILSTKKFSNKLSTSPPLLPPPNNNTKKHNKKLFQN